MGLEQKLSLKLTQKLVMTPSLQQAIKLLQMTRMELLGVVATELVENPVLEESAEAGAEEEAPREEERERPKEDELDHAESMANIDLDAYFSDYWDSSGYASINEEREGPPLENTLTREPDLYDHLLWQLHMADIDTRQREIAELIIGNLNRDGFLVASLEEIQALGPRLGDLDAALDLAAAADLAGVPFDASSFGAEILEEGLGKELLPDLAETASGTTNGDGSVQPYSLEEIEQALEFIRHLDPPGIACRDLQESLIVQIDLRLQPAEVDEAQQRVAELACTIIREHWELFLKRQFPVLAKKLGIQLGELEPAVDLIRSLDPRPGRRFSSERPQYIEPDVAVVKVGDEYVIQLNDDGMPRLRVSRAYRRMLQRMRSEGNDSDAQQFIRDKMRSAVWLIKSLDQRQRTIYKVANSIVRQQQEFLDRGIEHLRPMVLRDVAEDISMHESTVSRVVANKYIHTPRGLFPMKFFFHSGIDRDYGENISSLTVKRKIQQLIQEEDPKRPLSDSELMRVLKREGIQIARRTVAKYRDELGIASSTDRKQIF